jgi:glycosyltransferase involved in cell wall biosynthesis
MYRLLLFTLLLLCAQITAEEPSSHRNICLCMIVKNEKPVITRCLKSVLPIIDYWVIVDTGSTDGTQDVIKNFMAENNVKGNLYESPWVDFSHNRNEAMQLAKDKADYLLFIDADEYLVFEPDFQLPLLDRDYYYYYMRHETMQYGRMGLVSTKKDFKYAGVLHEALVPPPGATSGVLHKVHNIFTSEGARSKDPLKYQKDAALFEKELQKDPFNTRNVFYLAASYRDAGMKEDAIRNYERRVAMGGWEEEVFYSLYQIALLQEELGKDADTVIKSFNRAFQFRKSRVEPLYHIVQMLRQQSKFDIAYELSKIAASIPLPQDVLFVHQWMYEYGALLERSACAYWQGNYEECKSISLSLLQNKNLPPHIRATVESNLSWANAKLVEELLGAS